MIIKTKKRWFKAVFVLTGALFFSSAFASVRIKDIVTIRGVNRTQLVGYSLVVGLDGTGDSRRALFTQQSVRNMLRNFGLTVNDERMNTRNVAAVMVTATLTSFSRQGSSIDVNVSSLGDASSLEGGTLIRTHLQGDDGLVYAYAQGSLSIGGVNIETAGGERFRRNYALVGRVPGGALIQQALSSEVGKNGVLELLLREPDFTTAMRIAEEIDNTLGAQTSNPLDAATILVNIPAEYQQQGQLVRLIAMIESVQVQPDQTARVVINERTGTVVVGGHVRLSSAAVSQGDLTVRISAMPIISQPQPFSGGETVVATQTMTTVEESSYGQMMVIEDQANVNDLAVALNSLKVSPRDIISIFQALKQAGALQAELVIM